MSKAESLRVHEVRDAYRLIGECSDLGSDPGLWYCRMLVGVCRLIGAPVATGGFGFWLRPHRPVRPLSAYDAGFDASAREHYLACMREHPLVQDPIFAALQRIRSAWSPARAGSSYPTRCG